MAAAEGLAGGWQEHVERFQLHEAAQHDANALYRNDKDTIPQFLNGRSLRNYQVSVARKRHSNRRCWASHSHGIERLTEGA